MKTKQFIFSCTILLILLSYLGVFSQFNGTQQLLYQEEWTKAHAFAVQIRKMLLQCALDDGQWKKATLLLPTGDPSRQIEYAGLPLELEAAHKYMRALKDLKEGPKDKSEKKDETQ